MKKIYSFILLIVFITLSIFLYKNITPKSTVRFPKANLEKIEKISQSKPVMVYYGSPTCAACNEYYPLLHKLAKQNHIKIYYVQANKAESNSFTKHFNLDETPVTILINKNDQHQYVGSQSKQQILAIFKKFNSIEDD